MLKFKSSILLCNDLVALYAILQIRTFRKIGPMVQLGLTMFMLFNIEPKTGPDIATIAQHPVYVQCGHSTWPTRQACLRWSISESYKCLHWPLERVLDEQDCVESKQALTTLTKQRIGMACYRSSLQLYLLVNLEVGRPAISPFFWGCDSPDLEAVEGLMPASQHFHGHCTLLHCTSQHSLRTSASSLSPFTR